MKVIENSQLYLTKGIAIFIGTIVETAKHNHNSLQITLSLQDDFLVEFDDHSLRTKAILINSNYNHKLIGRFGKQILISIENESDYGHIFQSILEKKLYQEIEINTDLLQNLETELHKKKNLSEFLEGMISALKIQLSKKVNMDARIQKVIRFIDSVEEKKVTLKNLVEIADLSESRLQHLFKTQIGMSIKKYLQWKRLLDGIHIIAKGNDFTTSAHEAGFADSAHMSRTFKEMFGLNLFDLFHSSRSVQVIICDR